MSVELQVPGNAVAFGWKFEAKASETGPPATIRSWKAGDRVTLRYSSGPRKIKDVFERLKIPGSERADWVVVEWKGAVVWMQGADLQPAGGAEFKASRLGIDGENTADGV